MGCCILKSGHGSQNPTQPKGIGDFPPAFLAFATKIFGHKTPPSRKALETWHPTTTRSPVAARVTKPHPAERHWRPHDFQVNPLGCCGLSQNPTQPKGIGDCLTSRRQAPVISLSHKTPPSRKALETLNLISNRDRASPVTKPHPAERHWRRNHGSLYNKKVRAACHKTPPSRKALETLGQFRGLVIGLRVTKPHPAERHWRLATILSSLCLNVSIVTKPHPAERHWRRFGVIAALIAPFLMSQNPTQPKGIGDVVVVVDITQSGLVTKPHPAERHWRPGLTINKHTVGIWWSQNPTQPKGIGDRHRTKKNAGLLRRRHKTPPSRKALETNHGTRTRCQGRWASQNPTQPKGIGD